MKISKDSIKKHARKIRNVSEEEFDELHKGYEKLIEDVGGMETPMLLLLSMIGVAVVLIFNSGIFDLIGLVIFAYPFYLFVQKLGHQEGYFEGYYDHKCKAGSAEGKN